MTPNTEQAHNKDANMYSHQEQSLAIRRYFGKYEGKKKKQPGPNVVA